MRVRVEVQHIALVCRLSVCAVRASADSCVQWPSDRSGAAGLLCRAAVQCSARRGPSSCSSLRIPALPHTGRLRVTRMAHRATGSATGLTSSLSSSSAATVACGQFYQQIQRRLAAARSVASQRVIRAVGEISRQTRRCPMVVGRSRGQHWRSRRDETGKRTPRSQLTPHKMTAIHHRHDTGAAERLHGGRIVHGSPRLGV